MLQSVNNALNFHLSHGRRVCMQKSITDFLGGRKSTPYVELPIYMSNSTKNLPLGDPEMTNFFFEGTPIKPI